MVVLLGLLHTGLPSHSHELDRRDVAPDHQVISADHHAHGTVLIEQAERLHASPVQLAVMPEAVPVVAFFATGRQVATRQPGILRPVGRAPPPGAPRAPPQYL